VRRQELALRKELAVMHLRIARAELALERARPSSAYSAAGPAVELAYAVLERYPMGRVGHYLRIVLRVARVFLNLQHASGPERRLAPSSKATTDVASQGPSVPALRENRVQNGVA
jgi:hypothetical protein